MRVVCKNADGDLPSDFLCTRDGQLELIEGDEYTVTDSFIDGGFCWYILAEDPCSMDDEFMYGYDSERFDSLTGTESAVEEAIEIINLEPVVVTEPKKKWYQKIFQ